MRLPRVVRGGYVEKPWWTNLYVSPRPFFRAPIHGPGLQPTDTQGIHRRSVCSPCFRAHFGRLTTACVSSPRDWTVHIGSHKQQDTCISSAPPHPCAPCPSFLSVHVSKPRSKKWRSSLLRHCCCLCSNACFPPRPRRILHSGATRKNHSRKRFVHVIAV